MLSLGGQQYHHKPLDDGTDVTPALLLLGQQYYHQPVGGPVVPDPPYSLLVPPDPLTFQIHVLDLPLLLLFPTLQGFFLRGEGRATPRAPLSFPIGGFPFSISTKGLFISEGKTPLFFF